jgi:hypothetical protein
MVLPAVAKAGCGDSAATRSRSEAAKAGPKSSPLACCPMSSQASAIPKTTAWRTPSRSQWKKFMLPTASLLRPLESWSDSSRKPVSTSRWSTVEAEGMNRQSLETGQALPNKEGDRLPFGPHSASLVPTSTTRATAAETSQWVPQKGT